MIFSNKRKKKNFEDNKGKDFAKLKTKSERNHRNKEEKERRQKRQTYNGESVGMQIIFDILY